MTQDPWAKLYKRNIICFKGSALDGLVMLDYRLSVAVHLAG
jgi:hypothetical protein